MSVKVGHSVTLEWTVTPEVTAVAYGNEGVEVLATPALVGFCEGACLTCMADVLAEGQATVGTMVNIRHVAATPLGMKFWVTAKLIEVDRRRYLFEVEAKDEKEIILKGTHERFIINLQKFLDGVAAKKGN
ncbi:MAG: thioesterase family protein [Chloroflexota bacterium]